MSRNLEDPQILRQVKKMSDLMRALGVTVPRTIEAATQAFLEATRHPNSDVRVTCSEPEGMAIFDGLIAADRNFNAINWPKSASTSYEQEVDPKHLFAIVFKNGSTIELRTT